MEFVDVYIGTLTDSIAESATGEKLEGNSNPPEGQLIGSYPRKYRVLYLKSVVLFCILVYLCRDWWETLEA